MLKNTKIKEILAAIIEKAGKDYKPEKIILFGSYAQGNPSIDSDIDLLMIKDSNCRRDERDKEIRELLKDVKFPLDIFVYTPKEVEKFSGLKGSFINEVFSKGKVIYEQ